MLLLMAIGFLKENKSKKNATETIPVSDLNQISKNIQTNKRIMKVVLFGGSPERRDEVTQVIHTIDKDIAVHGALNEEEGFEFLKTINPIDVILIGGRYTSEQRTRIVNYAKENLPDALITQPGYDYPYSNTNIKSAIEIHYKKIVE
jgi:hypothetical protein